MTTASLSEIVDSVDYGLTASANEGAVGPRFLRITDIQHGSVDWSEVPFAECSERDAKRFALTAGDIVFARTGATTGKSFLLRNPPSGAVFASYLIRVRPSDATDPSYLAYFFQSPGYWAQIRSMAEGAAQPGVNASKLKSLKVPLLPLQEQKRIAAILDKADAIRKKRKEAIRLTEELLKSVFLDMFGDPVTNPKDWDVKPLGELLAEPPRIGTTTPASDDGAHRVVRVGEIGGQDVALERCGRVSLDNKASDRYGLVPGDFLLARAIGSESHLGKASIFQGAEEPVFFDSHVMRLRFDPEALAPEVFRWWLRSQGGRHLFMKQAGKTAVQFNVNAKQIARVEIPQPDQKAQQRFLSVVDRVARSSAALRKSAADADDLFGSLSQQFFAPRGGASDG